ncbi:MAG: type II toxin-antitoxin system RelE/ParE family toxin [Thermodesulfobacteriota bacterium]
MRKFFAKSLPKSKNCQVIRDLRGVEKITGAKSDWRIRIGTYRVIYEIDEDAKILKIMRIRHRREAYR